MRIKKREHESLLDFFSIPTVERKAPREGKKEGTKPRKYKSGPSRDRQKPVLIPRRLMRGRKPPLPYIQGNQPLLPAAPHQPTSPEVPPHHLHHHHSTCIHTKKEHVYHHSPTQPTAPYRTPKFKKVAQAWRIQVPYLNSATETGCQLIAYMHLKCT